jgi:hypothetical protein
MGFWDWLTSWFKKLNVQTEGEGAVYPLPGDHWYIKGAKIIASVFPNLGWTFDRWEGDLVGNQSPMELIMMANKTIVAIFKRIMNTLTISIVGSGTVTKSPDAAEYTPGTSVTLTAVPAAGWSFDHWTVDGVDVSPNPTIVVA